jgi:signal transduction histidine kinase
MAERIFDPLSRGATGGIRENGSIGLGLYIVKEIVDAHQGSISVTSSEANGTVFTAVLPRGVVEAPTVTPEPRDHHPVASFASPTTRASSPGE